MFYLVSAADNSDNSTHLLPVYWQKFTQAWIILTGVRVDLVLHRLSVHTRTDTRRLIKASFCEHWLFGNDTERPWRLATKFLFENKHSASTRNRYTPWTINNRINMKKFTWTYARRWGPLGMTTPCHQDEMARFQGAPYLLQATVSVIKEHPQPRLHLKGRFGREHFPRIVQDGGSATLLWSNSDHPQPFPPLEAFPLEHVILVQPATSLPTGQSTDR